VAVEVAAQRGAAGGVLQEVEGGEARQVEAIVDYIDAYASPVGNAFAYCDDV
jgi:hypothetical protein